MQSNKNLRTGKTTPSLIEFKWWPHIIFITSFLVYSNTIKHRYAYDDKTNIYANTLVQKGFAGIPEILTTSYLYGWDKSTSVHYRPLVNLTFAVEKSLFGLNPTAGHFTNIVLYGLLCIIIFLLLVKILPNYRTYVSALITLLFVLHPLHTEVVANIKSRDEILCMLFGIISLYTLLKYHETKQFKYTLISLSGYFLSFQCKETGFVYLGVYPLVLYFFSSANFSLILKRSLPYLLVAAFGIFLRMQVLDSLLFGETLDVYANSLVAAKTSSELFATRFTILLKALKLLVFPNELSCDYSYNEFPIVTWNNAGALLSLLIHACLVFLAFFGLRKRKLYAFALFFYAITYFMSSNLIFNIGTTFGERLLFAPSLAFCLLMPFVFAATFKIDLNNLVPSTQTVFKTVFGIIFCLYAIKTYQRNKVWYDDSTLFASGVKNAPNSERMHYTYANHIFFVSNVQNSNDQALILRSAKLALSEYKKASEISPKTPEIYYEMALVYLAIQQEDKAIELYKKAIEVKPDFSRALNNYGVILYNRGDYRGALNLFLKATLSKEVNPKAFAGLASCYMMLGNNELAIVNFKKALMADVNDEYSRINLTKLIQEEMQVLKKDTATKSNKVQK